ncbi:AraC family transcriptional regulator [Rhizorhabdus wittichii]|jgi:AraC-like DNA-binding protein|uniref:Transcriptional regulator, AraC family n=2 Tax=Rhizorhabdus wittichii TaxID=160791 RepID=A0A9J9LBF2_RHIWR|nr:AraC family transcriptional regulator [Rhizorhabdus wittichii]ABQ67337.1 transcriptional regulator, AraC family [Rhizorhabdus wittichii RW1]ARR55870.1 AraC family transcriptional regulator [Rhizorhabdus wittichii DC-6]QTH23334.1 AraC family transcriptional regulator [Rhizorhabdus wittichii]
MMITNLDAPRDWDGTGMPLSRLARLVTTDIDEVHDHMSRMFCPHDLRIEGGNPPIAFRHHQASLKSVTFNATDYGNPYGRVVVNIPPANALYLVQFSLSGVAQIAQENSTIELSPGQMCVLDPDAQVKQTFGEGYKHFTVKMSKCGIEAVLAQELGFRPRELHFSAQPVRLQGPAAAFAHLVRTICDDLDSGIAGFTHARACGTVEEALQRLLLAAVPHNYSELFDAPPSSPAPYYVRRVEDYIREHSRDPISLEEMIAVSGVSARSLHAGFRRFRDTTPMVYLKNHRLDLAHRQLKIAADDGLSVTEVALACGFTHLSKFARDYLDRFGERPSATLKRMNAH